MRAAILTQLNAPLVIADVDFEPLQFGQVLVRILCSGVCGAQLQEIRGEKGPPPPHLLGHEGAAIVEEIGPGVTRMKPGDKVICHWRRGAGIESDFPRGYIIGDDTFTSGLVTTFAEKSVCSENRLTVVPPDTDPELCALLGCSLSTALATIETESRRLGESVLIIGCGGLGRSLLAALELTTPGRVCVCDIHESKRREAELCGAEFVNTAREEIKGAFDLVLDTAGDPAAMEAALGHMAPSGRYVMIGQPPPGRPVCINAARHMFDGEGKTIRATQGGGFRPDLDIPRYLAACKGMFLGNLITHRLPLAEINRGLDLVRAGEAGRVLITMGAQ